MHDRRHSIGHTVDNIKWNDVTIESTNKLMATDFHDGAIINAAALIHFDLTTRVNGTVLAMVGILVDDCNGIAEVCGYLGSSSINNLEGIRYR